uniref:Uncharacterized protein n=1 Tax=Anguilla anguilla TaxID=7936 RepID=A0A0E9SX46_ANGAN
MALIALFVTANDGFHFNELGAANRHLSIPLIAFCKSVTLLIKQTL